MNKVDNRDFPFYQFQQFAACPGIKHFISSGSKSIGFAEESIREAIQQNRLDLAKAVGFKVACLVTANQVHSAHIEVVTSQDMGRGALDKESRLPETDAMITNQEDICIMVLSADCVPVLLYDPEQQVIAAVHAGWRGTAKRIVVETVQKMQENFHCSPENILAGIGPSIGKCCFEVNEEVAQIFKSLFPSSENIVFPGHQPDKYLIDLWEANRQELLDAGVKAEHIEVAGICTYCHPEHFFSYRREGEKAGRFGAGIALCRNTQL